METDVGFKPGTRKTTLDKLAAKERGKANYARQQHISSIHVLAHNHNFVLGSSGQIKLGARPAKRRNTLVAKEEIVNI